MTKGNLLSLLTAAGLIFAASAVPDRQAGMGARTTDEAIQQLADTLAMAIESAPRAAAIPPNVPDDTETPDEIVDDIADTRNFGRIPHPIGRVGLVRDGDEASRWIRLTRAVGAPDTCTRTSQQAATGEQWMSEVGPNFVKLGDGTWHEYRTEKPDVAAIPPNVPDNVADG